MSHFMRNRACPCSCVADGAYLYRDELDQCYRELTEARNTGRLLEQDGVREVEMLADANDNFHEKRFGFREEANEPVRNLRRDGLEAEELTARQGVRSTGCPRCADSGCNYSQRECQPIIRFSREQEEYRLCCNQNNNCGVYPAKCRNDFWPEFAHPRWVCCDDLYCCG